MTFKEAREKVRREIEEGKRTGDLPKGYKLGYYIGAFVPLILMTIFTLWMIL